MKRRGADTKGSVPQTSNGKTIRGSFVQAKLSFSAKPKPTRVVPQEEGSPTAKRTLDDSKKKEVFAKKNQSESVHEKENGSDVKTKKPTNVNLARNETKRVVQMEVTETGSVDENDESKESTSSEPTLPKNGRYPIGTKVRQFFEGHGWYDGSVVRYTQGNRFYQIRYEDGDEQELDHNEMIDAMKETAISPRTKKRTQNDQVEKSPISNRKQRIGPMTKGKKSPLSTSKQPKPAKVLDQKGLDDDDDDDNSDNSSDPFSKQTPVTKVKTPPVVTVTTSTNARGSPVRASFQRAVRKVKALSYTDDPSSTDDEVVKVDVDSDSTGSIHPNDDDEDDDDDDINMDEEIDDEESETNGFQRSNKKIRQTTNATYDDGSVSDSEEEKVVLEKQKKKDTKSVGSSTKVKRTKTTQALLTGGGKGTTKRAPPQKSLGASRGGKGNASSKTKLTTNVSGSIIVPGSYDKQPYSAGVDLPILVEPQQMFDDMIYEQLTDHGKNLQILLPLLTTTTSSSGDENQQPRTLRVATMCSGTESPILALDMIQKSIQEFVTDHANQYKEKYNVDIGSNNDVVVQLEHIFSCEIEPFKQAYIERNFSPPILFRDIRELGNDQAYTAYGALHPVPTGVDILIAGTSCVDYSNLNTKKKELEEAGESGQTFVGMLQWIEKAKPYIVIIENVYGAPWDKKVQMFQERGYSATFSRLDTKDFYIPHTRQRGYLFAIRNKEPSTKNKSVNKMDPRPQKWLDLVNQLKRPASATLDEFMLPNDDSRVIRGRVRLTAESMTNGSGGNDKEGSSSGTNNNSSRAGRVDWTKCETRHQDARSKEMLGEKRPLTEWSDSGNTTMPSFAWNEWTNAQVHRIHDLMDINTLRLAQVGMDCTYKTMVWNLSQNVDRDTMGKLGLCQCLTPTGVPYVTNRGGPLVGEELLLLQGIPARDLLLTKESEDNLKDLAGNAMSTTVVGSCALAAILIGLEDKNFFLECSNRTQTTTTNTTIQSGTDGSSKMLTSTSSLVPRSLVPVSEVTVSTDRNNYTDATISLGPIANFTTSEEWNSFLAMGYSSSRKCIAEGEEEVQSLDALVVCKECGQTASVSDAFPPRKYEEHVFEPMTKQQQQQDERVEPSVFRRTLLDLLPLRVQLMGFDGIDAICMPNGVGLNGTVWDQWIDSVKKTIYCCDDDDNDDNTNHPRRMEFRFTRVIRTHIWTAVFDSSRGGRLEIRVSQSGILWYLFARPSSKVGLLKTILERPVARLVVSHNKSSTTTNGMSLIEGDWELCLPVKSVVDLQIQGIGKQVPSWCNLLGLKGEFENEFQYETLRITVGDDPSNQNTNTEVMKDIKTKIEGEYTLLSKCGGACGSLRKKKTNTSATNNNNDEEPVFFFLSSGRNTLPRDDAYIFSPTCHRTSNGEYREAYLEIDPDKQYRPLHRRKIKGNPTNVDDETSDHNKIETIRAFVPMLPHLVKGSRIVPYNSSSSTNNAIEMKVVAPNSALSIPVHANAWKIVPELISSTVVVRDDEPLVRQCMKAGGTLEVNLQKARQVFYDIAYATSRLSIPTFFVHHGTTSESWLDLDQQMLQITNDKETVCQTCAPTKPRVRWTTVTKGNKTSFLPMEDGKEAAIYERRLKNRPHPWIVRLTVSPTEKSTFLTISISCNANSLVQRALGLISQETLPRKTIIDLAEQKPNEFSRHCSFEWRVVPHIEKVMPTVTKLTFTSNKNDKQADQPPNFQKYPLRKEQLRSLRWMLQQESTTVPFFEEEVTEAVLPCLQWRAEGRVRIPVLVRGGIIADEVGYGKTAITLGLIDSAESINGPPPDPPKAYQGKFIPTKATLVIVPKHLMGQWPMEVQKFVGMKRKVLVLQDMAALNKLTIHDMQRADVVVVSFAVLSNDKYFSRLARFTGVNPRSVPSGGNGGRHFNAVYKECLINLPERVAQILDDPSTAYTSITTSADAYNNTNNHQKNRKTNDGAAEEKTDLRMDGKKRYYSNGKNGTNGTNVTNINASTFKLDASERDPWKLSTSLVKNTYSKMLCPPLEMFFWNRIVVDEFTYLSKRDRERVWEVILEIKSSFRWCLSGTPKHGDFNDIQMLSSLLGVHLGIDEVLPGVKVSKRLLAEKESTGLESLSHYLESRSVQWHERRQLLAQQFLNRFVRQNIAEIDEIPFEEHEVIIKLPPAERAIYLELETHLKSLEMNSKNAQKSKKNSTGDRESRMQQVLQESASAEEALLKCCSHFNMSHSSATALETLEDIISVRQRQKRSLEKELVHSLAAALRQRYKIVQHQPDWLSVKETGQGEVKETLGEYLKLVTARKGVPYGGDDEINVHLDDIVQRATHEFEKNPTKFESIFADVNGEALDDIDSDNDDDDEGPKNKKRKKMSPKKKGRKVIDAETLFAMKQALRNHMHIFRSLVKELCGRSRSLRYIQCIRSFQQQTLSSSSSTPTTTSGGGGSFVCTYCKKSDLTIDKMGVLSSCGHSGCLECLTKRAHDNRCIDPGCEARVNIEHIVHADNLSLNRNDTGGGKFGAKLTAVVKQVKELIADKEDGQCGDRLIVFCQFDDLKEKVKEALHFHNIVSLEVKGTVTKQINTLSIFQKQKPDKNDPRVLLLKMDDEQSAGLNLTNLNHAIFVHPLLANSKAEYDAYETQAIGRIRRYGQEKTVHVWRFLAHQTIDTEIYYERSGKTLQP